MNQASPRGAGESPRPGDHTRFPQGQRGVPGAPVAPTPPRPRPPPPVRDSARTVLKLGPDITSSWSPHDWVCPHSCELVFTPRTRIVLALGGIGVPERL